MPEYNKILTSYSQKLRKDMTAMERRLWYEFLRDLPMQFKRQKPIGAYIVDFYCASAKLVIELDGSQHYFGATKNTDEIRDKYLADLGLTVLRYSDSDIIKNFSGVCQDILEHLNKLSPPPRGRERIANSPVDCLPREPRLCRAVARRAIEGRGKVVNM